VNTKKPGYMIFNELGHYYGSDKVIGEVLALQYRLWANGEGTLLSTARYLHRYLEKKGVL